MIPQVAQLSKRPSHYVCPSCHLYLLAWDAPTGTLEMFHNVGLWSDFWTGQVRLICQHCLGATEVLPGRLDRKSTRLNSSHSAKSRMPSSA